jgi:flavorubredoxin
LHDAAGSEIASNIYRISIYAQWGDLQFNHFLVEDDEPLLFHTGLRGMHAEIRGAISKLIKRSSEAMKAYQVGILADYVPYTPLTAQNLKKLANLKPTTLAIMHGSNFTGDCARALGDLNAAYREVFGREKQAGSGR